MGGIGMGLALVVITLSLNFTLGFIAHFWLTVSLVSLMAWEGSSLWLGLGGLSVYLALLFGGNAALYLLLDKRRHFSLLAMVGLMAGALGYLLLTAGQAL